MTSDDEAQWPQLLERAHRAGIDAFREAAAEPNAHGCGWAQMRVRPANSRFARWLSRNSRFYRDSDRGGLIAPVRVTAEELPEIPIQIVGQSYLGAQAYASAYAAVLVDAGFSATSDSWMS